MLKDFAKSFFIYGFASGLSKVFLILLVPIYTSIFSPEEYGILDILTGFVSLMILIGMLQMESAIARYYFEVDGQEKKSFISTAFWTIVVSSVIFSLLIIIFSKTISFLFFKRNDFEELIIISCPLIFFSILFNFLLLLLRYEKKPTLYLAFIFFQVLITVSTILYFIFLNSFGIKGIIYGQITGIALPIICLLYYFKNLINISWSKDIFIKLIKYSSPLIPSVAISWANTYFNRFIMLQFLSMTDIGIFSLAVRIASLFSLIEFAFNLTWGPFFWNTFSDKKNHAYYFTVFNFSCLFVFSFAVTATFFSKELVLLFSNNKYMESVQILGILFLSYCLPIFLQMVGLGAAVVKKTYLIPLISFLGLLVNIFLLFFLIKEYKILGVAIAALAGNVFSVAASWFISERLFYIGFSKIIFFISFTVAVTSIWLTIVCPPTLLLKVILSSVICILLGIYTVRAIQKLKNNLA